MRPWHDQRYTRGAVVALVTMQLAWTAPALAQGSVEDIASGLICLCGCNKLLNACDMDTARQMKAVISQKLDEGLGKQEIIDYMTATYGENVLAAPPKRGFNLTAWVTPFAAIVAGTVVVCLVVLAWVEHRRAALAEEFDKVVLEGLESKYGAMLERELKELER